MSGQMLGKSKGKSGQIKTGNAGSILSSFFFENFGHDTERVLEKVMGRGHGRK